MTNSKSRLPYVCGSLVFSVNPADRIRERMIKMKIRTSGIKAIAKDCLYGHWPKAIIASLIASFFGAFCMSLFVWGRFFLIMAAAITFLENIPDYADIILTVSSLIAIFHFFVGETVRLGYIRFNLSLLDKARVRLGSLFSCTGLFWKALFLRVSLAFIEFGLTILFILPGIYIYLTYAMAPYVLEERPAFPVIETMRASRKMMQGNKLRLLKLKVSFIGWDLLCILTFGFAALYVTPYKHAAEAVLYNEISGRAEVYYAREAYTPDKKVS